MQGFRFSWRSDLREFGLRGLKDLDAPFFEEGHKVGNKGCQNFVGERDCPEGFDERGGGGRGDAGGVDANELREDVGAEAFGTLGDGNAGMQVAQEGGAKGNRAVRSAKFAMAIAAAIIDAIRRARAEGNATEIITLGGEEKLDKEAYPVQEGVGGREGGGEGRKAGRNFCIWSCLGLTIDGGVHAGAPFW